MLPDPLRNATGLCALIFWLWSGVTAGQSDFYRQQRDKPPGTVIGVDWMDTRNFSLLDYRRMLVNGVAPTPNELQGRWRGVNDGIVRLAGYRQFIKEIGTTGEIEFGENVKVHQLSNQCLRALGWQPKLNADGTVAREGRFRIKAPSGRGRLGHAALFSYRDSGNPGSDPARLLVDRVVRIDQDHLLGLVTAKFGPVEIPLAYFMLERID